MERKNELLICQLIQYGIDHQLIEQADAFWCANRIADLLLITLSPDFSCQRQPYESLYAILDQLIETGIRHGVITDSAIDRDILDTKLTGILTPAPSLVNRSFRSCYADSPKKATDWFYKLQKDVNYIRADRIEKDRKWLYEGQYGTLEITINLSKPELDPKSIAAMKRTGNINYPYDLLCNQNVGFAGNAVHPSRMNLRQVPLTLQDEPWLLQYSPYAYFDQHCIVLTEEKRPMRIDRHAFACLLDFVDAFPHYFIGSNSDLPISGGSILGHEHFQAGAHVFAMNQAPVRHTIRFEGYPDIEAGIVEWPMSVIRLSGSDKEEMIHLATHILNSWQCYSDPENMIFDHLNHQLKSTITPIVHRYQDQYVMDLVLRNNLTTDAYPLGYFHPHPNLHHIKKENIGLIEVMGLAILPGRLQKEMEAVKDAVIHKKDLNENPLTAPHAAWVHQWRQEYDEIQEDHIDAIIQKEIGKVFEQVLVDCGIFRSLPAWERFLCYCHAALEP